MKPGNKFRHNNGKWYEASTCSLNTICAGCCFIDNHQDCYEAPDCFNLVTAKKVIYKPTTPPEEGGKDD